MDRITSTAIDHPDQFDIIVIDINNLLIVVGMNLNLGTGKFATKYLALNEPCTWGYYQ